MQGFSYNGIHSSSMGVFYIPSPEQRGDFYSDFDVISLERSWSSGGE